MHLKDLLSELKETVVILIEVVEHVETVVFI